MAANLLHCISYGVPVSIAAELPSLFTQLPALLPHGTETVSEAGPGSQTFSLSLCEDDGRYRCCEGTEVLCESHDLTTVCDVLRQALMIHVANHAKDRVFVHAGVVAYKSLALILPGTSLAGKSTLTAALVRAGAIYYSDEYAVVDEEGYVYPYARDLSMRSPGHAQQRSLPVSALGGAEGTVRLPVALVVFTQYRQGAEWSVQGLSKGMAILEMLRHSISIQRTPARVMATLSAMLQRATAWTSPRGEADATAAALLQWLVEIASADDIDNAKVEH